MVFFFLSFIFFSTLLNRAIITPVNVRIYIYIRACNEGASFFFFSPFLLFGWIIYFCGDGGDDGTRFMYPVAFVRHDRPTISPLKLLFFSRVPRTVVTRMRTRTHGIGGALGGHTRTPDSVSDEARTCAIYRNTDGRQKSRHVLLVVASPSPFHTPPRLSHGSERQWCQLDAAGTRRRTPTPFRGSRGQWEGNR